MLDVIDSLSDNMDYLLASGLSVPCELAHYTIVISGIKQSWGEMQARSQPFATWVMSLICCFGGNSLVNLFCGNPPFLGLANTQSLIFATLVWWLVFYCPRNAFMHVIEWMPMMMVLLMLKEMIRTRKIIKGVTIARTAYPSSIFLCSMMGMLGACGGGFIKNAAFLARSGWNDQSIKSFSFSLLTKYCLLFGVLYNLQMNGTILLPIKAVALLQATVLYAVVVCQYWKRVSIATQDQSQQENHDNLKIVRYKKAKEQTSRVGKAGVFEVGSKFGYFIDPFSRIEDAASSVLITYSAFERVEPPVKSSRMKSSTKYGNKNRKED